MSKKIKQYKHSIALSASANKSCMTCMYTDRELHE